MRRSASILLAVMAMFSMLMPFADAAAGIAPASRFKGYVKQSYEAAHKYPSLAAALFCYCGCDRQKAHRKLIDCFRDDHSAHCSICQDEMVRAAGYKQQGMSTKEIASKIDQEFKARYPYKTPSGALKRYNKLHGGHG